MVEPAVRVVQSQQQRANQSAAFAVTESAHHAIGRAQVFYLQHRPLARRVASVDPLGDHPVPARRARDRASAVRRAGRA